MPHLQTGKMPSLFSVNLKLHNRCKRCVLNMDHHCPWVGNCIGFTNRKFFILLLIYTNICVFIGIILFCPQIIELAIVIVESVRNSIIYQRYDEIDATFCYLTFSFCLTCAFQFVMVYFLRFHTRLLFQNRTTIELMDITRYVVKLQVRS